MPLFVFRPKGRKINNGKKKKKTKNIETASGVVYYIVVKGKIR